MNVCAVVGGQFGSEGKGAVVGHIAKQYGHHVRVGAANAGHTVYTEVAPGAMVVPGISLPMGGNEKHVMQQIPCAAYANPAAKLYIGPGAQISHDIFEKELRRLLVWRDARGLRPARVLVDRRAHVITYEHIEREQQSGLAERIGSTSTIAREGIGAAQAARVMRDESCVQVGTWYNEIQEGTPEGIQLTDTPSLLNRVAWTREGVLLEGTQGAGLSLTTGDFPYVTSRNPTSAGLCADAGLAPTHLDRVILVVRSYPIRVAGPSGPFAPDSIELTWEALGVNPEKERTTVTKKVRRVATFSMMQVYHAAQMNGATEIALMFADYVDPKVAGLSGVDPGDWLKGPVGELVDQIESCVGIPVTYVGTGPHSMIERSCVS